MKSGHLPPLEWVRVFEAAARLGSFTAAAEEGGVTQATVSQRIGQLEKHLGVLLFDRRARTIELTVDGEAWLPHVRAALDGLRESTDALFGASRGRLTISASQSIIDLWLMPRLAQLHDLTLGQLSVQTLVLGVHEAPQDDVIRIRYGSGDWPHPYTARLYAEALVPVAAPRLARRSDFWTAWPRIACAGARPGWNAWAAQFGIPTTPVPILRFDTHVAAINAAKSGLGVFLASLPLCAADVSNGSLVRLDQRTLFHHESYWLLAGKKAVSRKQWRALSAIIGTD